MSAATKSAVISYSGSNTTVNCTQTCSVTLSVRPGTVTFTINLYDGTNGAGNLLSTGTTTAVIQPGRNNAVAISFGGVPASLSLTLGASTGTAGSSASVPVIVSALDAAGLTIVGPDPYANPIALSDDDTSGTTTLSARSVVTPNDQITMRYNGGTAVSAAHITASVPGTSLPTRSATFTIAANNPPPQPQGGGTSYGAAVASASPVAYYRLNDTASTMTDSGPHALNGTYGSAVRIHASPLTVDTGSASATFPGSAAGSSITSNSGTVLANTAFQTPQQAITVEAWIQANALNSTNMTVPIVSYGRQAQGQAWVLQLTPQTALQFWFKSTRATGASYNVKAATPIVPGQIYHVVATYDGSSTNLYVNGAQLNSAPATGNVDYSGITSQYGLAIGGALGGTNPIFNGSISDVAVYPTALSASVVQNHFLQGHLRNTLTETPLSSDAFVDTIGINTHLSATGTIYTTQWSNFQSLFLASGIRHIRDGLVSSTAYASKLNTLAQHGVRASLSTSFGQTSSQIAFLLAQYANVVEAVAAPNEPDDGTDVNWIADTRAFQQMLWSTVKSNPATASLPVVAPPLVSQADTIALGDMSAYLDQGNVHDYLAGHNPGTTGWGSVSSYGTYGSISWNRNIASIISGSKPVIASESGYGDYATDPTAVDRLTAGKYMPRLFLEQYMNNIPRTTIYEFYDEGSAPGGFSNYGLVDASGNPKPAYYAIKSLISLLADPGSPFTASPVSYVISGNTNNLQHLLMQKRDGTLVLVLWLETSSYNTSNKTDLAVPAQTVTIQPSVTPSTASFSSLTDSGNINTTTPSISNGIITVPVDDHVSVLSFR